jgi:hypothetical protein
VGQLRLLIADSQLRTDPNTPEADPAYYYSDGFLEGFLSLNGDNLKLAAADALLSFAVNEAMVSKKIRKENLATDGPAVAAELRRTAEMYRIEGNKAKDEADAEDGTFLVVDFADPVTPWDEYEYMAGGLWH